MACANKTHCKRISQPSCGGLRTGAALFRNPFPMRFRTRAALPADSVGLSDT